jgi:hypothetical protein
MIMPVLFPHEGKTLAEFTSNKIPALVVKDFPDWKSVYCAVPYLPPKLWQKIGNSSGLHVYNTNTEDTTIGAGRLFAIYTISDGTRKLSVPPGCRKVEELFSGKVFPIKNGNFTITVKSLNSYLFLCQ